MATALGKTLILYIYILWCLEMELLFLLSFIYSLTTDFLMLICIFFQFEEDGVQYLLMPL